MKKLVKLFSILLLAVTMMLPSGVSAAVSKTNDKVTLQVKGLKSGDKVTFYRVVEVDYTNETSLAPRENWKYAQKGGVKLEIGNDKDIPESASAATEAQIQDLANGLVKGDITPVFTSSEVEANAQGVASLANQPAGVYVAVVTTLASGNKKVYNPVLLSATYNGEDFAPNAWAEADDGSHYKATKGNESKFIPIADKAKTEADGWTVDDTKKYKPLIAEIDLATDQYVVTGTAKSKEPSLDKEITGGTVNDDNDTTDTSDDRHTIGLGDKVDYKLTPTLPEYPYESVNKTIWLSDRMSAGLTYLPESFQVKLGNKILTIVPVTAEHKTKYAQSPIAKSVADGNLVILDGEVLVGVVKQNVTSAVEFTYGDGTKATENGTGFNVIFDYETLVTRGQAELNGVTGAFGKPVEKGLEITYSGIVNENAKIGDPGNPNWADYIYSNKPNKDKTKDDVSDKPSGNDYTELEDEEIVYEYEISIMKYDEKATTDINNFVKIDAQNAEQYSGAIKWVQTFKDAAKTQFDKMVLATAEQEADNTIDKYVMTKGLLAGAEFEVTGPDGVITTVVTNENGIATITDVKKGTYTFKETKAPAGYTLPTNATVTVEAKQTKATKTTRKEATTTTYEIIADGNTTDTQTGWLIGTSTNGKYYELDAYKVGTGAGEWTYNETEHKLTRTFNGMPQTITNVYKAKCTKTTTNSETSQTTIVNDPQGPRGVVFLNVLANTTVNELPSTGGIGTYIFTAAGVAIIAVASFMLMKKKED